ncbi:hypothetical protein BZL54_31365 [Burkholderia ubonensis subsp. mesacidophila]|uniref:Uncharacterized protein n=2 Tax=Burkholderia ubonensis TaxID=101571 RepID=A0A2A4F2C8_9BURK|nr:hypothetical protein BZL54_31365 [Burkholderia ubonensis subsp. mesacidophila]
MGRVLLEPDVTMAVVWSSALVRAHACPMNDILAQGVSPTELARRMEMRPQKVARVMNQAHSTEIGTIADALAVLGKLLETSASWSLVSRENCSVLANDRYRLSA